MMSRSRSRSSTLRARISLARAAVSSRGAYLLLQVRTRVLNDQLASDFHRWYHWYPGLSRTPDPMTLAV